MASKRIARQAATPVGLLKRLNRSWFSSVTEPRAADQVKFPLVGVLQLICLCFATGEVNQRAVERRSTQLRETLRDELDLPDGRMADNTVGTLLPRLAPSELRYVLHDQVKAEHARKGLKPTRLKSKLKVVAVDGKALSTLRRHDLERITRTQLKLDPDKAVGDAQIRTVFEAHFDHVQLVQANGDAAKDSERIHHGLTRVHRATLVSSDAAVCIDQRPIPGSSNESGQFPAMLKELELTYGRTRLYDVVTADAGNTSIAAGTYLTSRKVDYFFAIKSPNGDIHAEALRRLESAEPAWTKVEVRNGKSVVYSVFVASMPAGYLDWSSGRQLVRVERQVVGESDVESVGNRYFVTSLMPDKLTPEDAYRICRIHWRCENEGHWTADTLLREDARQPSFSRHPTGMLVASLLRMLAQNVVAVLRALSRIKHSRRRPTWRQVAEHVLCTSFTPRLDTTEFDACPG